MKESFFRNIIRTQVFIAGFVIMALEILGSRLLAPTFGSSIFVWGSLIGVFLISMAGGYFLGGRLSLNNPSGTKLSTIVIAASIYIFLIPFFSKDVCHGVDALFIDERWGSLFATIVIFSIPLALLGSVSPYGIRLITISVESAGNAAGRLYAISTLGSFLGTIITAFFLIPAFPVSKIVFATGLITGLFFAVTMALYIFAEDKQGNRERRPAKNEHRSS